MPGVVHLRTTHYTRRDPHLDLYQFFMEGRIPQGQETVALGSGVLLDTSGLVVTNYHVIKDASTIEVLFADTKQKTSAHIIGIDRKTDVALLRLKGPSPLKPLDLGDSDLLRIGDIVLAIGNPFGFSHMVTSGIISSKGRVIGTGPYDDFLQTDASIHPGNSGGPLIDIRGRVVGIATAVSLPGVGFAIPINLVKVIVADLQAYGKVKRPWLGIVGKNMLTQDDIAYGGEAKGIHGVIVANMILDAPAHRGGLKIGDLILSIEQQQVYDMNELQKWMVQLHPKHTMGIQVYRRGQGFLSLKIPLEEGPKSEELPEEQDVF